MKTLFSTHNITINQCIALLKIILGIMEMQTSIVCCLLIMIVIDNPARLAIHPDFMYKVYKKGMYFEKYFFLPRIDFIV